MPKAVQQPPKQVSKPPQINLDGVDERLNSRPHRLRNWLYALMTCGFLLLMSWQANYFFLGKHAYQETYRHYLPGFCRLFACPLALPDVSQITLKNIEITLHPLLPDALVVNLKLLNIATFSQPYPRLQLTLTDRHGRIVARRTFLPSDYLAVKQRNVLSRGELSAVRLELAHAHQKATGFAVELIGYSTAE